MPITRKAFYCKVFHFSIPLDFADVLVKYRVHLLSCTLLCLAGARGCLKGGALGFGVTAIYVGVTSRERLKTMLGR